MLIGGLILALPVSNRNGEWLNFTDALFISVSAVCVTGLSTVSVNLTFNLFGQIILLLLIQVGGIGFMTLTTFILSFLRRKKITLSDRLALQEAINHNESRGIVKLVKRIMLVTFIIEGAGAIILMPSFIIESGAIGVFHSLFISVSSFCNAGFDIFGSIGSEFVSLTNYVSDPLVTITVALLTMLGGLGVVVIMDVVLRRFRFKRFSLHSKAVLIMTAILTLFGWVFFFFSEFNHAMSALSGPDKILASFFQSVTTRTGGFCTVDQLSLSHPGKIMTMILMFIGASPGSTGGGIKTTTFAIIILITAAGLKGRSDVIMFKKRIDKTICFKAITVMTLGLAAVVVLTTILSGTEWGNTPAPLYAFESLLFEAFSAFGTGGLSVGVTPYLSIAGKYAVMVVMFFGRLGPLTIGSMFFTRDKDGISYPEGTLMIG